MLKQSILRHSIDVLVLKAPKRKRLDENGLQFCNGQQKMKPEDCFRDRELTRIRDPDQPRLGLICDRCDRGVRRRTLLCTEVQRHGLQRGARLYEPICTSGCPPSNLQGVPTPSQPQAAWDQRFSRVR